MPPAPVRILVVCTGNVCRSPMVERLLADELARRGEPAEVSSAGVVAAGMPVAPEILGLLRARGLDAGDHASRVLDAAMVAGADLVLAMAREHVREAVVLEPAARDRVFTLKELVRRGGATGPRRLGEGLGRWLDRVGGDRPAGAALGSSGDDDVTDPIGRSGAVFRRVGDELVGLTRQLADLAWPAPAPR